MNLTDLQGLTQVMSETLGTLMHHDTITGTSQKRIIQDQASKISAVIDTNADYLNLEISRYVAQQGLSLGSKLSVCKPKLNQKLFTCFDELTDTIHYNLTGDLFIAVYNPSVFDREYLEMKFGHSNLQVSVWNQTQKMFIPAQAEAFCIENSDKKNECDLIINEKVSFMETKIFKLSHNSATDISVPINS